MHSHTQKGVNINTNIWKVFIFITLIFMVVGVIKYVLSWKEIHVVCCMDFACCHLVDAISSSFSTIDWSKMDSIFPRDQNLKIQLTFKSNRSAR